MTSASKAAPAKATPAKKATATKRTTTPQTTPAGADSAKTAAKAPATRTKKAPVTTSSTTGSRTGTTKPTATSTAKTASKTTAKAASGRSNARKLAEQLRVKDDESPWSEDEISEVRGVLLEEIEQHRDELKLAEDELDDLLRASGDGSGDDQADAGAKTAEREHEISVAANARASLRQAEHALEQLDAGTYGICENCGNPIGKLRLQPRPRATL
jgi:RNA polymerase-binding transcription factor DksA